MPSGRLWIHSAAKEMQPGEREAIEDFYRKCYALDGEVPTFPKNYPRSALLGCVDVARVVPQSVFQELDISPGVRNESSSDFVFLCEQPRRLLMPLRVDGNHKIWHLPPATLSSALDQDPMLVKQPNVMCIDFSTALKKYDSGWRRRKNEDLGDDLKESQDKNLAKISGGNTNPTNSSNAKGDEYCVDSDEDCALAAAIAASLQDFQPYSKESHDNSRSVGVTSVSALSSTETSAPAKLSMQKSTNGFITEGNILTCQDNYIVHQCNCLSRNAKGLARAIFDKFPYANTYSNSKYTREVGTCDIQGNGKDRRFVVNLYGQFAPGKPKWHSKHRRGIGSKGDKTSLFDTVVNHPDDSSASRENYFKAALQAFEGKIQLPFRGSIAFPYGIGCNLAGGNWSAYQSMLLEFQRRHPDAKVVIYRLPGRALSKSRQNSRTNGTKSKERRVHKLKKTKKKKKKEKEKESVKRNSVIASKGGH